MISYSRLDGLAGFSGLAVVLVLAFVCYSDNVLGYLVFNIYAWMVLGALFQSSFRFRAVSRGALVTRREVSQPNIA